MTPKKYSAPSVRQLAAVVDAMAGSVSEGRMRQLRMVVDMFGRAVGRDEMPKRSSRTAEQLFTWAALRPFWAMAVAGELRHWEKDVGKPLPLATQRVVRSCLEDLAARVLPPGGKRLRLPELDVPELKPTVDGRALDSLYRGMVDLAARGPLVRDGTALSVEDRARVLAMVAVLLDAAPRSGEMAAQSLADLAPGEVAVGVRRRSQRRDEYRAGEVAAMTGLHPRTVSMILAGQGHDRSEVTEARVLEAANALPPVPEVEWFELRPGSRVAVRRWLEVRQQLVDQVPLTGQRTALWVSLVPSKAGPAGLPLRAQGLRQGYARGITALNWVMAGSYGWEPLPTTMEQIRRSVDVVPLLEPPV
ncbi:hypothetical protein ACWCQM_11495 [Streptomyces sp. NPDC002125]